METLKAIEKLVQKEKDNPVFTLQLISDGDIFVIPPNALIRLFVGSGNNILISKQIDVLDAEAGKVQFSITEDIGVGKYNCEVTATFDGKHLTFPTEGYQSFQINRNLESLEEGETLLPTDYEIIISRVEKAEETANSLAYNKADVDHIHLEYVTEGVLNNAIESIDVSDQLATKADKGHNHDSIYAKIDHVHDQYLTEHIDISGKADKSYVDEQIANVDVTEQLADYATKEELNTAIANVDVTEQLTEGLATKADKDHTHSGMEERLTTLETFIDNLVNVSEVGM